MSRQLLFEIGDSRLEEVDVGAWDLAAGDRVEAHAFSRGFLA